LSALLIGKGKGRGKIKHYKRLVSLDFELYNTMYYWSICWAGVCVLNDRFEPAAAPFDVKINPVIKHKFTGGELKFPFTGAEIRTERVFGEVAHRLLSYLDEDTLVIGHAFENDAKMLIDACHKYNIMCPSFDFIDTNALYNAAFSVSGERSLSKLAAEFGIEFTAHDPLEDARAAYLSAEEIVKGDLYGFLEKHGIEVSKVENGLVYRGLCADMTEEKKHKTGLYNKAFEFGRGIFAPDKRYYFEPNILSEQNLEEVLEALKNRGYGFSSTAFAADVIVTNNLFLGAEQKVRQFRSVLRELDLAGGKYDFSPKKVRDKDGKTIPLDEYYKKANAHLFKEGVLNKAKIAFSKGVEKSNKFETLVKRISLFGGYVSFNVQEADFFLIENAYEIKSKSDGRIRAYRRSRAGRLMTVDEFLISLK
jgi:hypothetical protein